MARILVFEPPSRRVFELDDLKAGRLGDYHALCHE